MSLMPKDLFSCWWIVPNGMTHVSDCKLRFRHHRHRPRSSQDVRRIRGVWCRPGRVITWEPIEAVETQEGK